MDDGDGDGIDPILMKSECRLNEDMMKELMKMDPEVQEDSFSYFLLRNGTDPCTATDLKLLWVREKAEVAWGAGDFAGAIELYKEALRVPFGGEAVYQLSEFYNSNYIALFKPEESWVLHIDMVSCCGSMTQVYMQLKDYSKVWFVNIQNTNWYTEI